MSRLQFDWTINAGHVLTFIGFIVSGFLAFSSLDKRVVVLEQAAAYQSRRDADQEQATKDAKAEIKESLRDMRTSIDKLVEKIDKKG